MKKTIIVSFLILISVSIISQVEKPHFNCGFDYNSIPHDYGSSHEFFKFTKEYDLKKSGSAPDTVPVQVHFVRNNDGSGQATTLAEMQEELNYMNSYFTYSNIYFYFCPDTNVIDDSTYFNFDYETEWHDLFDKYRNPHAINVFMVDFIKFFDGSAGGLGSGLGHKYEGIILRYDMIGYNTVFTHEMGHVFHLRHTHGKYNWELSDCANDSWDDPFIPDEVWCMGARRFDNDTTMDINSDDIPDCMQTGDDVCDTPAEPNLSDNSLLNGCIYIGSETDGYGELFEPRVGNIMSYGPSCDEHLTPDQYTRMRFAFETYGLHLQCGGCDDYDSKTVINNDDTGIGSFRWALECASWNNRKTTVLFDIDQKSTTIQLHSRLPFVYDDVIIDGTSQEGGEIILDGSLLTEDSDYGLYIYGDSVEINGITMQNFPSYCIMSYNGYDHFVLKNSTLINAGYDGLYLRETENAIIHNNTISDCGYRGIFLDKYNNLTRITGNKISDNYYSGIEFYYHNNNIVVGDIGDENANIFTNNNTYGLAVWDSAHHIEIYNNYFGTGATATLDSGNVYDGIIIYNANNVIIGDAGKGNVLSGNRYGIGIYNNSHDVIIKGNKIGTDITGAIPIPNNNDGIYIDSSSNITIGGTSTEDENIIANNGNRAIQIRDQASSCLIQQNSIFCNTHDIYIEEGSNSDVEAPTITNIPDNYTVQGTSSQSGIIWVYKSDNTCPRCEGKVFLGSVAGGTSWEVTTSRAINNDDKITAMLSADNNSSVFGECYTATGLPYVDIEKVITEQIQVYPNPARPGTTITIKSPNNLKINTIEIFNSLGQSIYHINPEAGISSYELSLPAISTGIYTLHIINEGNTIVTSLVICP